jgi:phosphoribosylglycinamide formyltransferase-1
MGARLKVAVLASGRGSNLRALLDAIDAGSCAAEVVGVLSDRSQTAALELAHARGLSTRVVAAGDYSDRDLWDAELAACIAALSPGLVVLAGFMRIVGRHVLARFPRRIVNVHPALLPAFPGLAAPAQAIRAGARVSGCTVHLVDAGIDSGPILAQAAVAVRADDDADSLHSRIQRAEHALLPAVVNAIAVGSIVLDPLPHYVGGEESDPPALVCPPLLLRTPR